MNFASPKGSVIHAGMSICLPSMNSMPLALVAMAATEADPKIEAIAANLSPSNNNNATQNKQNRSGSIITISKDLQSIPLFNTSPTHQQLSINNSNSVEPEQGSFGNALTDDQKLLQFQILQRLYKTNQHNSSTEEIKATDPLLSLASAATVQNTVKRKKRPPNANVQHYDSDVALHYNSSLTPRTLFDRHRKTISRLTITLIMQLNIEQIRAIRSDFDEFPGGVDMATFVSIMTQHIYKPSLSFCPSPALFIQSLVELFEAMDLDGDHSLEWEELLSTIVHMGMGATDHLVLSPINPYREGPVYSGSKVQNDKFVRYHPMTHKLIYVETDPFTIKLLDPSMKGYHHYTNISNNMIVPRLGQHSIMTCEYIWGYGKNDEVKIGTDKNKGNNKVNNIENNKNKTNVHNTQEEKEQEHERQRLIAERQRRMEEKKQAEVLNNSNNNKNKRNGGKNKKEDLAKVKADNYTFYKTSLQFTSKDKKHNRLLYRDTTNNMNNYNNSSNSAIPLSFSYTNASGEKINGQYVTDLHSDEVYYIVKERSNNGNRFNNDDLLVTSTSQYLSLWEGLPSSEPLLVDSKKIRSPYTVMYWCIHTQRLFTGDVHGSIHCWRIVNAVDLNCNGGSSINKISNGSGSNNATNSTGNNSNAPTRSTARLVTTCKLVKEREYVGHKDSITCLVTIPSMSFLLSSSLDHSVRMWDISTGVEKNKFIGHRSGVIDICYSNEYRFLLSASIDHDVCVWSPFATHVVFKLIGHTAPLVGVQFISNTPQIVTADTDGWMKIWDARNFTCCQTFMSLPSMNSFTNCGDRHARLFVCGRQSHFLCFDQEGGPYLKATDDDPIYIALYSSLSLSFITCNRQDLKLWNSLNGRLSRVYRGLSDSPISAICFDKRERKIFVGDKQGKIRVYNALTGAYMKSLSPHAEEIVSLEYILERRELLSVSIDRNVKIHDERPIEEQKVILEFQLEEEIEILATCVCQRSHLMAYATSDSHIAILNIENSIKDEIHRTYTDVSTCLNFLEPFPLILASDEAANLFFYYIRPSPIKGELALAFNTASTHEECVGGVTTVKWDKENLILLLGNIHGQIICYEMKEMITTLMNEHDRQAREQYTKAKLGLQLDRGESRGNSLIHTQNGGLKKLLSTNRISTTLGDTNNKKAVPLSTPPPSATPATTITTGSTSGRKVTPQLSILLSSSPYVTPLIIELLAALRPKFVINAHSHAISSVTLIQTPLSFVTTARMHKVKVWDYEGNCLGIMDSQAALAQSYSQTMNEGDSAGGNNEENAANTNRSDTNRGDTSSSSTNDYQNKKNEWKFVVDVEAKERNDRKLTEAVLDSLEEKQNNYQPEKVKGKINVTRKGSKASKNKKILTRRASTPDEEDIKRMEEAERKTKEEEKRRHEAAPSISREEKWLNCVWQNKEERKKFSISSPKNGKIVASGSELTEKKNLEPKIENEVENAPIISSPKEILSPKSTFLLPHLSPHSDAKEMTHLQMGVSFLDALSSASAAASSVTSSFTSPWSRKVQEEQKEVTLPSHYSQPSADDSNTSVKHHRVKKNLNHPPVNVVSAISREEEKQNEEGFPREFNDLSPKFNIKVNNVTIAEESELIPTGENEEEYTPPIVRTQGKPNFSLFSSGRMKSLSGKQLAAAKRLQSAFERLDQDSN